MLLAMHKVHLRTLEDKNAGLSAGRPPFILIIDDSITVRKIVETTLRREGFEVKGFGDGVEALRWLASPEARLPGMIFLDIHLPKMDGYAVARALKARPRFEATVMVMLTRRDGVIDRILARLAGARYYLTKPFQTQHIVALVKTCLENPATVSGEPLCHAFSPSAGPSRSQPGEGSERAVHGGFGSYPIP
jgi:twitching motility two-component system response regulator PilG